MCTGSCHCFLFFQPKYRRVQLLDSDDDEEQGTAAEEGPGARPETQHIGGDMHVETDEDEDDDHESSTAVEPDAVSAYKGSNNPRKLLLLNVLCDRVF